MFVLKSRLKRAESVILHGFKATRVLGKTLNERNELLLEIKELLKKKKYAEIKRQITDIEGDIEMDKMIEEIGRVGEDLMPEDD